MAALYGREMDGHRRGALAAHGRRPRRPGLNVDAMEFRCLGNSGLKVSALTYGNWLTHGSQIENETVTKCVAAAIEAGITSFDTADVYANTQGLTIQLVSNQPQYSMLWRVIDAEVVPASKKLGISQIVWSPVAQVVLAPEVLTRIDSVIGVPAERDPRRTVSPSSRPS